MTDAPRSAGQQRTKVAVLLVVLGLAATLAGVIMALVTRLSITQTSNSSSLPTLPVHENVKYTQHLVVPDYTGFWVGIILAVVGALVLVAGVVIAFRGRRAV